jgi:glucan-binding YG repeat protein
MTRTEDLISPKELQEVFGADEYPTPDQSPIKVCAGEWVYEDGLWRFYEDEAWGR